MDMGMDTDMDMDMDIDMDTDIDADMEGLLKWIKSRMISCETLSFEYRKSPNFDHQTELRPLPSYLLQNHLMPTKEL
jgi:hypothetical protein